MKQLIKSAASSLGWFIRQSAGLPIGVSLGRDWRRIFGRDAKTLLDVGAHKGESVDRFLFEFPRCRIFSFEPVEKNFSFLSARFSNHPAVECFQLAMGAERGTAEIVLGFDSQTHSLKSRSTEKLGAVSRESVVIETLDYFAKRMPVNEDIDLLKIDTEGYEIPVLQGAAELLSTGRILSILAEATLVAEDDDHTSLASLQKYLLAAGFELSGIYDQECCDRLEYFNALFVRRG